MVARFAGLGTDHYQAWSVVGAAAQAVACRGTPEQTGTTVRQGVAGVLKQDPVLCQVGEV